MKVPLTIERFSMDVGLLAPNNPQNHINLLLLVQITQTNLLLVNYFDLTIKLCFEKKSQIKLMLKQYRHTIYAQCMCSV